MTDAPTRFTLITAARLLDGTGAMPIEQAALLMEDDRIVALGRQADVRIADGVSAGGRYVEMRAEMEVIALISNCPQLNNPCNAYNPTPVRLLIWN